MSDNNKKSLGRPRSARSHQAILQATLELLAEVGYERMSMDAIAARAGASKTTIYRRYTSKEELVADAIESRREEFVIPDTGSLWGDLNALINSAKQISFTSSGQKTVVMMISTASSNPQFAQVYWTKYLQPRRQAFAIVFERAKLRNEAPAGLDPDLVFDLVSGIMIYTLVFQTTIEPLEIYLRRALKMILREL